MKVLFFLVCILYTTKGIAQDTLSLDQPVTIPQIVVKAPYGKLVNLGEISVRLQKIVTDSRCPAKATCIWAGEAIAIVELYTGDKLLEEKQIKFSPTAAVLDLYSSKNLDVHGVSLKPYPNVSGQKINNKDYTLHLNVKQF